MATASADNQPTGLLQSAVLADALLQSRDVQRVVINLNSADDRETAAVTATAGEGGAPANASPPGSNPATAPAVRSLLMICQESLPFILIILAKMLYDHRLGILVFAAMFGTLFYADSALQRFIAQRETNSSTRSVRSLLWLIVFISGNIFFIYYIFEDQKLYRSLYLMCPAVDRMTLWVLLWVTITTDFVVKFLTVIMKAVIALTPRRILPLRKKGKWYMMIEMLSQSYRSVLPVTPWFYFLLDDESNSRFSFAMLLFVAYVVFKAMHLFGVATRLRKTFVKFFNDSSYGSSPSRKQLESYDSSCPICQDKFINPVSLTCTHIFCEDCVSAWFNREQTCPMCRAKIVDTPVWRDGATSAGLQIF